MKLERLISGQNLKRNAPVIFGGITIFLFGMLLLIINAVGGNQDIRNKAAGGVNLALVPATTTQNVGDTFPVTVTLDTAGQAAAATEIHLSYNPTLIQAQSIQAGTFLPTILPPGSTITSGMASIILGSDKMSDTQRGTVGTGILLTVTFKALAQGTSTINFDPTTQVAVVDRPDNAIDSETGATVTVGTGTGATITAGPTPTCMAEPACLSAHPPCMIAVPINGWCPTTPTPTSAVQPTPTRTPTPTPTPLIQPTATPQVFPTSTPMVPTPTIAIGNYLPGTPSWWNLIPDNLRNFLEQLYVFIFYFGRTSNMQYLLQGIFPDATPTPTPTL